MMILRWFKLGVGWIGVRFTCFSAATSLLTLTRFPRLETSVLGCCRMMQRWLMLDLERIGGRLDFAETRPLELFQNTYL
jgi:hypothetical protein